MATEAAGIDSGAWLAACRRMVAAQRELFAGKLGIEARTEYEGFGAGGDRSLVLDREAEEIVFAELESLRDEGKLRAYGAALGPAIGWREEGLRALEERRVPALQTVYNLLEQRPGRDFLEAAEQTGASVMARVPTSSGLLEDKYTPETTFSGSDHRRHRKREWLLEGLQKVERLRFLVIPGERTMAQAALRFILAQPAIACVVPTVTTTAELEEFAGAADAPDLTSEELERIAELHDRHFDVEPAQAL